MNANEAIKAGSDCLIIGTAYYKRRFKKKYKKYTFIFRVNEVENLWHLVILNTLEHLTNHPHPPHFIGFVVNYPKSKRFVKHE